MKEIKIIIRIDEEKNKIGFLVHRNYKGPTEIAEILKTIGVLDMLKKREEDKLTKIRSVTIDTAKKMRK